MKHDNANNETNEFFLFFSSKLKTGLKKLFVQLRFIKLRAKVDRESSVVGGFFYPRDYL